MFLRVLTGRLEGSCRPLTTSLRYCSVTCHVCWGRMQVRYAHSAADRTEFVACSEITTTRSGRFSGKRSLPRASVTILLNFLNCGYMYQDQTQVPVTFFLNGLNPWTRQIGTNQTVRIETACMKFKPGYLSSSIAMDPQDRCVKLYMQRQKASNPQGMDIWRAYRAQAPTSTLNRQQWINCGCSDTGLRTATLSSADSLQPFLSNPLSRP